MTRRMGIDLGYFRERPFELRGGGCEVYRLVFAFCETVIELVNIKKKRIVTYAAQEERLTLGEGQ